MLTPLLRKSNAPLCFLGPSFVRSVVFLFFKLGRGRGRCGRSAIAPGSRPFDLRSKEGRRRGPFLRHRTGRRIVSRREGGVRGGGGERGAGARDERGAFETGGGGGLRGRKGGIRYRDGGKGRNREGVRERARRSGRTHLRQVRYHGRARRFVVVPSSSEREIGAKEGRRARP